MLYVGIDPGKHGGFAVIRGGESPTLVWAKPLPPRGDGWLDTKTLAKWLKQYQLAHVSIERAQAFPKQGIASTARYMEENGKILALIELIFPVKRRHYPRPKTWKQILIGGHDKLGAIRTVEKLYPDADLHPYGKRRKPHDGVADAICIAEWSRLNYPSPACESSATFAPD